MGQILYKYTTLESLALIYVFISSWMNQPLESIAMWKLYSNMNSGVKIGLQRNPFKKYTVTNRDIQKVFPGADVNGTQTDLIVPTVNAADVVYKAFVNTKDLLSYYDLQIKDDAYYSMEITLSP